METYQREVSKFADWLNNQGKGKITIEQAKYTPDGDVNADGQLTVIDVVLLQKWLLAVPDTALHDWEAGNFCRDDRLDTFDLCLMKKRLVSHQTKSIIRKRNVY